MKYHSYFANYSTFILPKVQIKIDQDKIPLTEHGKAKIITIIAPYDIIVANGYCTVLPITARIFVDLLIMDNSHIPKIMQ